MSITSKCQCSTVSAVERQKIEDEVVREDAQEAASIPGPIFNGKRKIATTQTCTDLNGHHLSMNMSQNVDSNNSILQHTAFSKIWSTPDDPAPQWLIGEALRRGEQNSENNLSAKTVNSQNDDKGYISPNLNHESIIADLEKQLCATRSELVEALNEQLNIKNKYKNAMRNVKVAADEKCDEMQRKLVQICTSIIEKFGPKAFSDNIVKSRPKKHQRPLQHFGKLSRNLHRKLKIATMTSFRLKKELLLAKTELNEKSRQYDSLVKCFSSLKMELKNTELNFNDMMNENVSLRKKIDDTQELMHTRASKKHHEKINAAHFREIQRSRGLKNLKKKNEEDLSTIAQLRSKLLRSESANSNKGFLLNSYKTQLADLAKEKDILSMKTKELEIDNNSLRNGNAQLRANLTLINGEKEKLISTESEKLETDIRERQSKLAMMYERSMLQKIDTTRAKYNKTIEAIEIKSKASENLAEEYLEAINRFLKEIDKYHRELDAERDLCCSEASEREAHETACEILNITPGELTGFLKGRSPNRINSWLSDIKKITTKKYFAEELGKFLFNRAIDTTEN